MKRSNQQGVGLIEVLVALLVLAIGVLGFVILQVRAVEATGESTQRIQAINIARDLAERVRSNRSAWERYKTEFATAAKQKDGSKECVNTTNCTAAELADYDARDIEAYASSLGMHLALSECPITGTTSNGRQCIFVAWNDTEATSLSAASEPDENSTICMHGTAYRRNSTCLMMEIY